MLDVFTAKLAELNDPESRKCHLNCSHDISCSAAAMAVRFDVDTEDRSGALWDTGGPTNPNSSDCSVRIGAWLNVG